MYINRFILTLLTILSLTFHCCGQQTSPEKMKRTIASKEGYTLTEKHLALYLKALESYDLETITKESVELIKLELKRAFLEDPKAILRELNALSEQYVASNDTIYSENGGNNHKTYKDSLLVLTKGHSVVRQQLGGDIGQMKFDSAAAKLFRSFLANSLLIAMSSRGDSSGGISAENQIQFCVNGTYTEYRSAQLGGVLPGIDFGGTDEDNIPGYWEVASLPNGMLIILLYSTHHLMLEDMPNGLLPFPVGQYTENFVALPNGDGYRRTIKNCN